VWKYPIPDFTQFGLEIWKVLAEIRLLFYVQCKYHSAKFQETRPCLKNFIKEFSREFLYNLVSGLDLDPKPHTDAGDGRIDGQTNVRDRHIKRFFFHFIKNG